MRDWLNLSRVSFSRSQTCSYHLTSPFSGNQILCIIDECLPHHGDRNKAIDAIVKVAIYGDGSFSAAQQAAYATGTTDYLKKHGTSMRDIRLDVDVETGVHETAIKSVDLTGIVHKARRTRTNTERELIEFPDL